MVVQRKKLSLKHGEEAPEKKRPSHMRMNRSANRRRRVIIRATIPRLSPMMKFPGKEAQA